MNSRQVGELNPQKTPEISKSDVLQTGISKLSFDGQRN